MNIIIRGYLSGSFVLQQEPGVWNVIVILDSGLTHTDFVSENAIKHIYLRFDDVDRHMTGKRLPQLQDLQRALNFARGSSNLMVCCRAGQSRSAAVAFVIACSLKGYEAAAAMLNPARHSPNSVVVALGAEALGDPLVMQTLHDWRKANQGVVLLDFISEIEREFDELEAAGAINRIIKR
jgi:predicted protein tyrosine phosphatase